MKYPLRIETDIPHDTPKIETKLGYTSNLYCGKCGWKISPEQYSWMNDGTHDLIEHGVIAVVADEKGTEKGRYWFSQPGQPQSSPTDQKK